MMFGFATAFKQDIGNWDVGNGNEMILMCYLASVFEQDPKRMVRFQRAQPWGSRPAVRCTHPLTFLGHLPVPPHAGPWTKTVSVCDTRFFGCRLWRQQLSLERGRYNSIYTGKHYGQLQLHGFRWLSLRQDAGHISLMHSPIFASDRFDFAQGTWCHLHNFFPIRSGTFCGPPAIPPNPSAFPLPSPPLISAPFPMVMAAA